MENLRVRKQWLCDEQGNIAYKPLHEWFKYFNIVPSKARKNSWSARATNKTIDIELANGNGMTFEQYEECKNKLFFVGNADLPFPKLREKYY